MGSSAAHPWIVTLSGTMTGTHSRWVSFSGQQNEPMLTTWTSTITLEVCTSFCLYQSHPVACALRFVADISGSMMGVNNRRFSPFRSEIWASDGIMNFENHVRYMRYFFMVLSGSEVGQGFVWMWGESGGPGCWAEVRWVSTISGSTILGTALVIIFSLFDIADVLAGRQQGWAMISRPLESPRIILLYVRFAELRKSMIRATRRALRPKHTRILLAADGFIKP